MGEAQTELWWRQSKEDLPGVVLSTLSALERTEQARIQRFLRNAQLFEGRALASLHASSYYTVDDYGTDQYDVTRFALARSVVNTALAKVAGKQKPKTQFVCNDADWATKRRAKKMERLVEAVFLQRQGTLRDGWEVAVLAFRDCLIGDCGVLKFWADTDEKKIQIQRVLPWEIIIDPEEAQYGEPQNLFHTYGYDRDNLAARFPEHAKAIMDAPSISEEKTAGQVVNSIAAVRSRKIKVRECWRLPLSDDEPGVHALVIPGATLVHEPWTRRFFPFEFFVWEPWLSGMFGTSLVDIVGNLHEELNGAGQRWADAERKCSNGVTFYEEGSVSPDALQDNRSGIAVAVNKGTPREAWPQFTAPNYMGEASIQWINLCKALGFEFPGVSQQAATGNVPQGVKSGEAQRVSETIATERFSIQWQQFERVVAIGATRQIIACIRELAEEDKNFEVRWPGGNFYKPIKWADVSLEDDQFIAQPYAVSGLVNTPQDRLSLASELSDRNKISDEAYFRIIQAKDIDGEFEKNNIQSQLIEKWIDEWLDLDPDKILASDYTPRAPEKACMNLVDALVQVARAWLQAEYDGAPDENLKLFRDFIKLCDRGIKEQQAEQATMQAAAKGNSAAVNALGAAGPPGGAMPAPAPAVPAGVPIQ